MLTSVQYHPDFCDLAKRDMDMYGSKPYRWDNSHELTVIDEDDVAWYVGSYSSAESATKAGFDIEELGEIPNTATRRYPARLIKENKEIPKYYGDW